MRRSSPVDSTCVVCLESILNNPSCEEETSYELICKHIFHKECIEHWLEIRHTCPTCRHEIKTDVPERPQALHHEMTREEILAVQDPFLIQNIRNDVLAARRFRVLDLSENTPTAATARKVNTIAARIFGFGS